MNVNAMLQLHKYEKKKLQGLKHLWMGFYQLKNLCMQRISLSKTKTRSSAFPFIFYVAKYLLGSFELSKAIFLNMSLYQQKQILHQKYENHPEVLSAKIELERIQEELERYRNFKDEKEVLLEEIQHLKNQLHYMLSSSMALCRPPVELVQAISTVSDRPTISALEEAGDDGHSIVDAAESRWITLTEELRVELEKSKSLSERLQLEVESEKQCSEELKGALEMAMQGHARILEQYCELQEKHASLLSMCRTINDGIEDVKKEAAKAGVRGAESKFINALARQVSILRAEREKERRFWMDENKDLQQQLSDTAEAVQAAGELLVRLNDAEEAASLAQVTFSALHT